MHICIHTWLQNPTPRPSNKRPIISISMLRANPFSNAPIKKNKPPRNIEALRPNILVVMEAKKEAINAARYNEDVNKVRS